VVGGDQEPDEVEEATSAVQDEHELRLDVREVVPDVGLAVLLLGPRREGVLELVDLLLPSGMKLQEGAGGVFGLSVWFFHGKRAGSVEAVLRKRFGLFGQRSLLALRDWRGGEVPI
jgi:hypothetical protein